MLRHPFERVDIAGLDADYAGLLARAAELDTDRDGGLTRAEALLFRAGLLAGEAQWALAGRELAAGAEILTAAQLGHALAETALIRGAPALEELGPRLAEFLDISPPTDLPGALALAAEATCGGRALDERQAFALGLGVSWGARCWET